ncbi:MAG: hypothetical protein KDD42_02290 [Bdellovibrionales bacterium]|nr:hypothetical protein [Bdellovibrionales bacterium]
MVTYLIFTVIAAVLSLAIIVFSFLFFRRKVTGSVSAQLGKLQSRVEEIDTRIENRIKQSGNYASKGQYDSLQKQFSSLKTDLEKEKDGLKALEPKLEACQKSVEEKESEQQELKSAKEEDEVALRQLLDGYESLSSESVQLEQQLAVSMKNLDSIMKEVDLTDEQKAVLEDLSNNLTNAGSTLRDLMMEYDTLNERLNMLQTQLEDLEEEYTKLVEKQLGE